MHSLILSICLKYENEKTKAHDKSSITRLLETNLGQSVGVAIDQLLVWFTGLLVTNFFTYYNFQTVKYNLSIFNVIKALIPEAF